MKLSIFTREYTKCTAGSTFCFVVVVVVVLGKPLIKLASISADSWSNMIRHDQKLDQTRSDLIRHDQTWSDKIRHAQTRSDTLIKLGSMSADSWSNMIRHDQIFYQTCSHMLKHDQTWFEIPDLKKIDNLKSNKYVVWNSDKSMHNACRKLSWKYKAVLLRQDLQKNVLKRQGRLVSFDCGILQ
jgi:hypothetical protein